MTDLTREKFNIAKLQEILLENRGISKDKSEVFFHPSFDRDIFDPFFLDGMKMAIKRIKKAIDNDEYICIYSDYDCDGIPGAVIFHDFFEKIKYEKVIYYIPHRHNEGYGLHKEAIERLREKEVSLLITVDLGSTNVEEVDYANKNNIDVIITDHHLPTEKLPEAFVIINPNKKGDNYPNKGLCGAGVAWKVIDALIKEYSDEFGVKDGWQKWLLDMVAIATLSDMMPLLGENRVLVKYGFVVIKKNRRVGLSALFDILKMNPDNILEDDITFMISPRLNAASRMDHPKRAFNLLSENQHHIAKDIAHFLTEINDKRKLLTASIMKDVNKRLSSRKQKEVIVVGSPGFAIGVLGLVAGKILDEHNCPVFVWGEDDKGIIKGSCRSPKGYNLVEMMSSLPDGAIGHFGGHENAGGFSITKEKIHFLEEELRKVIKENPPENNDNEKLKPEAVLSIDTVDNNLAQSLSVLRPFGISNPKPLFLFRSVMIDDILLFGKQKNHLKMICEGSGGRTVEAIAFFETGSGLSRKPEKGDRLDIVGNVEESFFRGRKEIRIRIADTI